MKKKYRAYWCFMLFISGCISEIENPKNEVSILSPKIFFDLQECFNKYNTQIDSAVSIISDRDNLKFTNEFNALKLYLNDIRVNCIFFAITKTLEARSVYYIEDFTGMGIFHGIIYPENSLVYYKFSDSRLRPESENELFTLEKRKISDFEYYDFAMNSLSLSTNWQFSEGIDQRDCRILILSRLSINSNKNVELNLKKVQIM